MTKRKPTPAEFIKRKPTPAEFIGDGAPSAVSAPSPWTPQDLLSVKHLGPGIIGQEMFEAVQAYLASTSGGKLGPAIVSDDPQFNQAPPRSTAR